MGTNTSGDATLWPMTWIVDADGREIIILLVTFLMKFPKSCLDFSLLSLVKDHNKEYR